MRKNGKISLWLFLTIVALGNHNYIQAQSSDLSKVWVADNGDGTYKNPVLYADYSDPDVCRVGDDYYMTASSFNCVPGLPILHSNDLVNWQLIGYALEKQPPFDVFNTVQHGCGVWAPCIRYFKGEFYIFYPDPDYGIYMVKSQRAEGPWSKPLLIKPGKGIIDPAPFWDEDGQAYLAYAFAGSRAGTKSVLMLCSMDSDASGTMDDDILIFDGHKDHPTVEGPKLYKHQGYYYVFAPAGGVSTGWQLILRSRNITGPYEWKTVMAQGSSPVNGPHQGAWVTTNSGEDWFLHFQDQGVYGRVLHLNPMKWISDWPVIGVDKDGDGCGEPVMRYKKPDVGRTWPLATPPESDEFNDPVMGLQWQWHANKHITWGYPTGHLGYFRINCIPKPEKYTNLWQASNLMLQKFPANQFKATTGFTFTPNFDNEEFALVIMGRDYSFLSVKQVEGKLKIYQSVCRDADRGKPERLIDVAEVASGILQFAVEVSDGGQCQFFYSTDGKKFLKAGEAFKAREGQWIGAKMGFVALREGVINNAGYADVDWFRVGK